MTPPDHPGHINPSPWQASKEAKLKPRRLLTGLIIAAVLAVALNQASGDRSLAAPLAPMGTAFTYQGQLVKGGEPVNDTCDFLFSLYAA